MASDYTDSFAGEPYFIKKGEQLSAAGMNTALNTKEKVANKVTAIDSDSTDEQYPTAKAVYASLDGTNNNLVHKTGNETIAGTKIFSGITSFTEPKFNTAKTADAANDGTKIASEAQVYAVSSASSNKQDKLPIGTILMYDGANWLDNVTLPGWYCCDRGNHSKNAAIPNLEDLFIKGKGSAPDSGGSNALTSGLLPKHTHGLSDGSVDSDGSHGHEFLVGTAGPNTYLMQDGKYSYFTSEHGVSSLVGSNSSNSYNGWPYITTTDSVRSGGAHKHHLSGSTNDNAGVAGAASNYNNMPSYYSVIYIKKVTENNA